MNTSPQQDRPIETLSVAVPRGAMQVIFSKNPMTIVWLLFILCLSLTLRIWVLAKNTAEENAQVLFSLYTQQVESRLQERLKNYEQFLRNQGALWESPLFLDSDWKNYVSNTDLFSTFSDIEFIGFAALEASIPLQFNRQPTARIQLIAPQTVETNRLLNQDLLKQLDNPPNKISGTFIRTEKRNTRNWLDNLAGRYIDIVIPLEKTGPPMMGGRSQRGLVFGSINISSLINSVTENQLFRTSLRLYESSSPLITSSHQIIYETKAFHASTKARSSRLVFPILDRFWIIDFTFPTELAAQSKIVNTLIWISGLLFSLIIFGINKSIVDYNRFILLRRAHEDLKANELRLKYDASHDLLTGLYNRQALAERFSEALRYASENQREIAIVFIDIDNLKDINDRLGHN